MNENQKNFLKEFYAIIQKYNIDDIYVSHYNGAGIITIVSNNQRLEFARYRKDSFLSVRNYVGEIKIDDI